ncbi:MAG: hypothetical protein AABX51_01850 [Nanoarchaeota archaeon]
MQTQQRTIYLTPENLLRYLAEKDDNLDTLITCKGTEVSLATYDQDIYEAIGSMRPEDELKTHRLLKLLEVVDILPFRRASGKNKRILTNERIDELRTKGELQ